MKPIYISEVQLHYVEMQFVFSRELLFFHACMIMLLLLGC